MKEGIEISWTAKPTYFDAGYFEQAERLDVDSDGYKVVPEQRGDILYIIDDRGNLVPARTSKYFEATIDWEKPLYVGTASYDFGPEGLGFGTAFAWQQPFDFSKLAINKEKEMGNKGLYVVTVVDPERDAIVETTVIARSEIGALMKVWNTEPDLIEVEYDDCDVRVKREMPVREAKSNCERS